MPQIGGIASDGGITADGGSDLIKCHVCTDDASCASAAYRCTEYAGARVCLLGCTGNAQCGANEVCKAASNLDGGVLTGDGGAGVDGSLPGRCVPSNDPQHCGACATTCGPSQTCCNNTCKSTDTDVDNCGVCGRRCGVDVTYSSVASYTCGGGTCGVGTCVSGTYNVDSVASNGCECLPDAYEPGFFQATVLQSGHNLNSAGVADSGYDLTVDGNLVPAGDNDFYIVHVTDGLFIFLMKVTLSNIPAGSNYDLYVYRWDGSRWNDVGHSTNAGNAQDYVEYGGNTIGDDTAYYGFEVRYVSGPVTCAKYRLNVHDD